MANVSKIAGLVPVQYANGNPWNGQARTYYIPSTDTNAYAIGDPVSSLAAGSDANGVPGVVLNTVPNALRGVIVGVGAYETLMADPNNLNTIVVPATKTHAYYVMVVDDPDVIFAIQESGTALTAASAGLNANLNPGANNGYVSGWTILNSSVATTATLQLKLWGLVRTADNAFGTSAKWLVTINNHERSAGTAGV
jgi:hypothetical protein